MSNYIHGSEPEEQVRLSKLNELINSRCLQLLEIYPGEHILDVGSGLGQFTIAMAEKVGENGKCLGIERDKNQLKSSLENLEKQHKPWVEFRQGNAENIELHQHEWGTFHLAHARFILEHVKQPENVVVGMAKAVRPGGRVVLADDDHQQMCLHPEPAGFPAIWQAYIRSYDRLGNDPFIGRRLVSILHQCGLRNIRNNVVFFGDSAESPTFQAYVSNLIGILLGAKELMIKHSLIDDKTFTEAILSLQRWSQQPNSALWYTINWAEGTKA